MRIQRGLGLGLGKVRVPVRLATVEADHRAPIEHMLGYVAYPALL